MAKGREFTTTDKPVEVAEHPLASVTVTVTEYEPLAVGVVTLVVAPVLHKQVLPDPPLAVKVTFPPWQKVVAPKADIVAVGNDFTNMV